MNFLKVYKKEFREIFRDKRTSRAALIMPFLMSVVLAWLFAFIGDQVSKPKNQRIHVVKTSNSIIEGLRAKGIEINEVASESDAEKLVKSGNARVVLAFEPDFDAKVAAHQPTTVRAYYNPSEQVSQIAEAVVSRAFEESNDAALASLLRTQNIPVENAKPIKYESKPITKENDAAAFLGSFLPYLIVIWAFYGGMGMASDLIAGEKDRGTLETMLVAPIKRSDIALGKFLTLATLCFMGSFMSTAGMFVGRAMKSSAVMGGSGGITLAKALEISLLLLPAVALFASVMVAVSTYSRNVRESQTNLTQVSFLVLFPAMFSQFLGFSDLGSSKWINAVPVLGTASGIRLSLIGKLDTVSVLLCFGSSSILAAIGIWWAIRMYHREKVLTRI